MTSSSLLPDAQRYLQSCSPAGLTVTRFEVVDDVAELTAAFTPDALDRVLRAQLRATGGPADWADPHSPTGPGTRTWAFAMELVELFNDHYFGHMLLERHETALETILATHGHEGTPVTARPDYTPAALVRELCRLKDDHLGVSAGAVRAADAA